MVDVTGLQSFIAFHDPAAATARAAAAAGGPQSAVRSEPVLWVGHILQLGVLLPFYLPGNGGLLAAVALLVTGGRRHPADVPHPGLDGGRSAPPPPARP